MEFPKTNNEVVCIVATGYAWEQCMFGNPKWDYWTLNNMYEAGTKTDVFTEWFQLHRPGSHEGHVDDEPMRKFLAVWDKPAWVQKDWGDEMPVKNPWTYPIVEVVERYCPKDVRGNPYPYFTNSVDYMLCLAHLRGYKEVRLYGVEFISNVDEEYYKMRQSVNYYLGRLAEAGMNVVIQPHSSMLKTGYWYAYENPKKDPLEKIMFDNLGKLRQDMEKLQKQRHDLEKQADVLDGGRQTLEQLLKIASLRDKGAQI